MKSWMVSTSRWESGGRKFVLIQLAGACVRAVVCKQGLCRRRDGRRFSSTFRDGKIKNVPIHYLLRLPPSHSEVDIQGEGHPQYPPKVYLNANVDEVLGLRRELQNLDHSLFSPVRIVTAVSRPARPSPPYNTPMGSTGLARVLIQPCLHLVRLSNPHNW